MRDFGEFIKYLRRDVLEAPFNQLKINVYEGEVSFGLYDEGDICIIYNGDEDNITCMGISDNDGYGLDMGTVKDVYKVMEAIKEHHELLDEFLK